MNPTESQTNEPPPVSAVRFRPEPPSQNAKERENREKQWWSDVFSIPVIAALMKMKGVARVTVWRSESGNLPYAFELLPEGESALVYELVDATSEEQYFPLGVFFDAASAALKAQDHFPQRWDGDHVRARKIGLYGGSYAVLWRGEWHYDYDAGGEWKLVEQQTGTLEKPLPITRA